MWSCLRLQVPPLYITGSAVPSPDPFQSEANQVRLLMIELQQLPQPCIQAFSIICSRLVNWHGLRCVLQQSPMCHRACMAALSNEGLFSLVSLPEAMCHMDELCMQELLADLFAVLPSFGCLVSDLHYTYVWEQWEDFSYAFGRECCPSFGAALLR